MRFHAAIALTVLAGAAQAQLFVGQSDSTVMTKNANVSALPSVTFANLFPYDVQGAARGPGNLVYICNGFFTTYLYGWNQTSAPQQLSTVQVSGGVYGLGYVNGKLYGFANYASPMGIYELDPLTGAGTLAVDTSAQGYRFFALDGNPLDGQLYGYTEYGSQTGLYRIDPLTGAMTRVAGDPPGSYGMCRGMAVGNNTAFLVATHPTDTFYAYDLGQGPNGTYVAFTNPYPTSQNGGGAWLGPTGCVQPASFCTSSTTTNGCVPAMGSSGSPSLAASAGFTLACSNVEGQQTGLIFYSASGAQALPWTIGSTSFFCVKAPVERTPAQNSGGTLGSCNGALSVDWRAFMAASPTAVGQPLVVGRQFWAQGWFRDPPAPKTTNLSNGLQFTLCP